jgi:hypothetical protein
MRFPPCSGGRLATVILLLLASSVDLAASQAVKADNVDFSTMEIWRDLKSCVQCLLQTCSNNVVVSEGCYTNACICRDSTLGGVVPKISSRVLSLCSNFDDASTAVSVMTAYCASQGYTAIVEPTIIQTTGAYTVTVTAASVTVVQTRVVSAAASTASPSSAMQHLAAVAGMGAVAFVAPFVWLFYTQALRRPSGH